MMKYPFDPELLDALPEELAELFRSLEITLLQEICSRLKIKDNLNEVTIQDIRALRSHGISLEEIQKVISKTVEISEDKLNALINDVVERNQRYHSDLIDFVGITQPQRILDYSVIDAIRRQTEDEFSNITRSLGFLVDSGRTKLEPAKAYQWALDNALLQIDSGAINYNEAIKSAVRQLADSGIRVIEYKSGHMDHADVAVRRAVMTGVSQLCAKYNEQSAEYLGTDFYEISAHIGARDVIGPSPWSSHKAWQGKVYSIRAGDKYPNIYSVCGLGYVDGLEGANCRHIRFPFVDGVSERTYTDEELAHIDDGHDCTYEGKHYSAYEATQKQREIERTIRKLKREEMAYKSVGLKEEETAVGVKRKRLEKKYREFSNAAGLPEQKERTKATFIDKRSEDIAQKAKEKKIKTIAKTWKINEDRVIIEKTGVTRINVDNDLLPNGLPINGIENAVVDKLDSDGAVLQRRIYGADGKAVKDFDTSDHGLPSAHQTGAHKHLFNYKNKNPHGKPLPLTEKELAENSDIIQRGVNYHG